MEIIARYGFEPSEDGIEDMMLALKQYEDDADVYVNAMAIEEALYSSRDCLQEKDTDAAGFGEAAVEPYKPATTPAIYMLLRSLLLNFSEAWFQESMQKLQRKADARTGRADPDGYYHLPGRAELALQVQKRVLPHFGFEGTKEGVADMIRHCAAFLPDPDVAHLFDAINKRLGMSPAACLRFRHLAESLEAPSALDKTGKCPGTWRIVRLHQAPDLW